MQKPTSNQNLKKKKQFKLDAGQLNRRIAVDTRAVSSNNFGKNDSISWTSVATGVPAKIEFNGGGEVDAANQRQGEAYVKFVVRFREDLTTKMRIGYNGKYYGIERIADNPFGNRMFIDIFGRIQE